MVIYSHILYITIWLQGAHIPTSFFFPSMVTGFLPCSQATSACGAMMRNRAAMTLTPCMAPPARRGVRSPCGRDMGRNSRMDRNPMCGCDGKNGEFQWRLRRSTPRYLEIFLFWKVHVWRWIMVMKIDRHRVSLNLGMWNQPEFLKLSTLKHWIWWIWGSLTRKFMVSNMRISQHCYCSPDQETSDNFGKTQILIILSKLSRPHCDRNLESWLIT